MPYSFRIRNWLLAGSSGLFLIATAGPASAIEVEIGEIKGNIDTTVSQGFTMRAEDPSCRLISVVNGGCLRSGNESFSQNADDKNLNFDKWDIVNATTKFTTDIEAAWRNFGAFVRIKGYYDVATERRFGDGDAPAGENGNSAFLNGTPLAGTTAGPGSMTGEARDLAIDGIDFLDYYVYGNFDVAERPLQVRLGNQAINWGESLIFQGGINSFLPLDLSALRTPGAELKEGLLPQPTIYASYQVSDSLSVEAMYIYEYTRTTFDACGSYFAVSDSAIAEGCRGVYLGGLDGTTPGLATFSPLSDGTNTPLFTNLGHLSPDDQGQFGAALRYYAEDLLDGTEFGLYFVRSHLKLPIATTTNATQENVEAIIGALIAGTPLPPVTPGSINTFADACGAFGAGSYLACSDLLGTSIPFAFYSSNICDTSFPFLPPGAGVAAACAVDPSFGRNGAHIAADHPEDVDMVGLSWSTTLFGSAFAGEFAYYPSAPLQVASEDMIIANTSRDSYLNGAFVCDFNANGIQDPGECEFQLSVGGYGGFGGVNRGYDEQAMLNAQFSTITLDQDVAAWLGANAFAFIANVGVQYLPEASRSDRLATARTFENSSHPFVQEAVIGALPNPADPCFNYLVNSHISATNPTGAPDLTQLALCERVDSIYADNFSAGYRLVANATYPNVFNSGIQLTPQIAWRHDVYGNSAGPIGPGLTEGVQAINVGISFDYLSAFRGSLQYNTTFGNGEDNFEIDKDYVTFDLSYSF